MASPLCKLCDSPFTKPILLIPQCGHSFCARCLAALPTRALPVRGGAPIPLHPELVARCPTCAAEGKWASFDPTSVLPNFPLQRVLGLRWVCGVSRTPSPLP